ncbi:transposase [Streptomyces monashensis]|uniref:transposase n=1 Tax=Streptomyces monashensis TaxID=1678012 RepID=UPI003CCBFF66
MLGANGCSVVPRGRLTAAKILRETAGITRLTSKSACARHNGTAPRPVSSGNRERHRLSAYPEELERGSAIHGPLERGPRPATCGRSNGRPAGSRSRRALTGPGGGCASGGQRTRVRNMLRPPGSPSARAVICRDHDEGCAQGAAYPSECSTRVP